MKIEHGFVRKAVVKKTKYRSVE